MNKKYRLSACALLSTIAIASGCGPQSQNARDSGGKAGSSDSSSRVSLQADTSETPSSQSAVRQTMNEAELREVIGSKEDEASTMKIISAVREQFPDGNIEVGAVMSGYNINFAFYIDSDPWELDVTYIDPITGRTTVVEEGAKTWLYSPGFKMEATFKFLWFIFSKDHTVRTLMGKSFGFGVGSAGYCLFGGEIGVLPGWDGGGWVLMVGAGFGFGGGLEFQRLEIHDLRF